MVSEIIDVHAHVYPEGGFTEVIKDRPDFELVENARGQSLLYRGNAKSLLEMRRNHPQEDLS
jgi:hypothetical protein